jgi:hypothetical protein
MFVFAAFSKEKAGPQLFVEQRSRQMFMRILTGIRYRQKSFASSGLNVLPRLT